MLRQKSRADDVAPSELTRRLRAISTAVFAIYVCLLAFVVLWPTHVDDNSGGERLRNLLASAHSSGWLPLWFDYSAVEWLANVVLFVPGGFLLVVLVGAPLKYWVPLGALVCSCGVEALQLLLPERTSSLADVAANSLGGLLGWCMGLGVLKTRRLLNERAK